MATAIEITIETRAKVFTRLLIELGVIHRRTKIPITYFLPIIVVGLMTIRINIDGSGWKRLYTLKEAILAAGIYDFNYFYRINKLLIERKEVSNGLN